MSRMANGISTPIHPSELALRFAAVFPYVEGMQVNFTPEQEAQLTQLASKVGTNAEHLVKEAALRLLDEEPAIPAAAPELPVWHLGAVGPLHRRDIYDDLR
jgi:hypothetical protein